MEGVYIWDNSKSPVNFTAWGESEPNGLQEQNCIAATSQHFYFWSDESCYNKYQPICESPVKLDNCPGNDDAIYSPDEDRCYVLNISPQTWNQSVAFCKTISDDAHLVSNNT